MNHCLLILVIEFPHFFSYIEAVNFVFKPKKDVFFPVADEAAWQNVIFCVLVFDFDWQTESEKLADFVWKALNHAHF